MPHPLEQKSFTRFLPLPAHNENFITDNSATLSGFLRCCIQDIDLPDSSDGASVANGIGLATLGAAAAGLLVILVGALVRAPLQRIPENTLKFIVGIMLTTFGTFWSGESFGINWPLSDLFLLILAALYLVVSLLLITAIKQRKPRVAAATTSFGANVSSQEKEAHP